MKQKTIKVIAGTVLISMMGSAFADPVLDRIYSSHQVNIGVRDSSAPLSYKLPDGSHVGMAIDICNAVVDELKKKDPTIKINYIPVTSDNRIPLTKEGKIDMECGSTTNNNGRRKDVNFSVPYYISGIAPIVLASSNINSILDIPKNSSVGFTQGTSTNLAIFTIKKLVKIDWDAKHIKVIKGKDHKETFNMLTDGKIAMYANDDILDAGLVATSKDPSLYKILPERFSVEPYGIMTNKNATELHDIIDHKIISMMKMMDSEPGSFKNLYNKWFMQPIPPYNRSLNWKMPDLLKDVVRMPTAAVGN